MGRYPPRVEVAPRVSANQSSASGVGGFHTVRGGIDPGDHCFCPRFVGTVEAWKDLPAEDGALSFAGAAEPWRSPEGQLSPRAPHIPIGRDRATAAPRPMGLGLEKRCIFMHLPTAPGIK